MTLNINQMKVYARKSLRLKQNLPPLIILTVLVPILFIFAFGQTEAFVTYQTTRTICISLVGVIMFTGAGNSAGSICHERKVVKFEYQMKSLDLPSYILGKAIPEILMCAMESAIFTIVIYVLCRNGIRDALIQIPLLYFTGFFIMYVSDMFALLLSSAFKNSLLSTVITAIILLVSLFLSGLFSNNSPSFMKRLSDFMIPKWGATAMFSIANRVSLVAEKGTSDWTMLHVDEGAYAFSYLTIGKCWLIMILISICCIAASMWILKLIRYDRR